MTSSFGNASSCLQCNSETFSNLRCGFQDSPPHGAHRAATTPGVGLFDTPVVSSSEGKLPMLRSTLASFALAILAASTFAHATPYVFEPRHSQGVMHWSHLGFSNPNATFSRIEGTLDWNAAEPSKSSVKATIPMSAFTTGVPDLDDDFRSEAFFDFARYPAATFTSTHVEKGADVGGLRVTGDLALHGVTKPVTLDVHINKVGTNPRNQLPTVGFEATAMLKRSDFNLGRFVPQVSDEIRIALTIEAADAVESARLDAKEAAEEAAKAAKANGA